MKSTLFVLILVMSPALFSCNKSEDPDYSALNNQIVAEWERVSDSILATSSVPGMLIGIWAPDRNLTWVVGKGKANLATGEKPGTAMSYRMASLTKTYTYTVLLQLADAGTISLSDKLDKYFPGFPKADSVTIRMLCNHTSGIFDYLETNAFLVSLVTNPLKKWSNQEMIDLVRDEPYYFSPGTTFRYSNTNTIFAGAIIQQITGNLAATEIRQRILDPLHLVNTHYPDNPELPVPFVHGYGWGDEDRTDVSEAYDPSFAGDAGAMITVLDDMKVWVKTLYEGTLLSPQMQAERLTVVPAIGEDCEEYGLGIMHKIDPSMWGHTGTIPGYKNWAGYCPEKNVTIVISYNATTDHPMVLAVRLMKIYMETVKQ